MRDWNINGQDLCKMNVSEFHKRVPNDPGDLFWTHLELLRKCKLVGKHQMLGFLLFQSRVLQAVSGS